MPQCTGCSKSYRFLDGERCEPCSESPTERKPRSDWPLCPHCSKRFEFLEHGTPCLVCQQRDSQDLLAMPPPSQAPLRAVSSQGATQNQHDDIQYAMTHPVNARTHSTRDNPVYRNPLQSYDQRRNCNENDPRYKAAQEVYKDFKNGYADSMARANPGTRVSKPKFKGIEDSVSKPVAKIHIVIRKIHNRYNRKISTPFDPQMTTYEDTRLWSEVADGLLMFLDGVYSSAHGFRIRSKSQFTLYYTHGHCALNNIATNPLATLRDVWRSSIEQEGLMVQSKAIKTSSLELDALVDYPANDEDSSFDINDYQSHTSFTSKLVGKRSGDLDALKRKRIESFTSKPFKRSHNSGGYVTDIAAIRPKPSQTEYFLVYKITVTSDNTGLFTWSTSDTSYEVLIEKKEFSSGAMKRAYKLQFNNEPSTIFAAKQFYEIGDGTVPTATQNFQHLKEELARQIPLQNAIKAFTDLAISYGVSIYDLRIPTTFLLQETDSDDGMSWLVDPLLDHSNMRKFSGSNKAGSNVDFAGQTCDAFAHFTLVDSMVFVAVDIQGIDMPVIVNGIKGANVITLLDSMAHSREQTMGLGDNGMAGIEEFCKQHQCNMICKKLGLPPLDKILSTLTDLNAEEGSIIVPPNSEFNQPAEEEDLGNEA